MATFKVVLDGIYLSAEQSQRISRSIQRAVLNELAEINPGADSAAEADRSSFAWLPVFKGPTMGLVATQPPDTDALGKILADEFGS